MERMNTSWSLINPLLECEVNTYWSAQKYLPFEDEIKDRIEKEILSKNTDISVSLYFRNLRNGPWFGINEDAEFAPASLMKLPVAMAYVKWSESYPELLKASFTGVAESIAHQNITPGEIVEADKSYTVDDLIKRALIYSDNNANQTLLSNIPTEVLFGVLRDLSIPVIDEITKGKDDYISVREYASFFRILYNASYLTREGSRYLLDVMSHSMTIPGLRTSVRDSVLVAHKFGERRLSDGRGWWVSQFHDCGIVYHETYPYLICVMSKWGDDIPRLERVVEQVSRVVYEEVEKKFP
jgi:beta-lactamase class A